VNKFLGKLKEHLKHGGPFEVIKLFFLRIKYLTTYPKRHRAYKLQLKADEKAKIWEKQNALPAHKRGVYFSRHRFNSTKRTIGRLLNTISIFSHRNSKILVVLHFFYEKSIDEVIEYLKNLSCYNYDLIVTYPNVSAYSEMKKKIHHLKPDAKIIECPNKGYDIGSFIKVVNGTNLKDYDIVFKLQTKSTNKSIFIYNQYFEGHDWFKNLWDGVLGSYSVHRTIRKLCTKNKKYGLVAAKNLIIHDPKHKQALVQETIEGYGKIKYQSNYRFVAGSCFAIRARCLQTIQKAKINPDDFEETKYGFFSLAHVIERAICFSGMSGYKYYGNRVDLCRKLKWARLEKKLNRMSALQIAELPQYEISPDFVWHVLESRFLEKYEIVEISLKDIKREYFDGTIKTLQECEPYLYLNGNINKYKKYVEFQEKHNLPHMSIARFDKLMDSIKKNGYNKKYPIIIGRYNYVWDGQHRACILMKLYGEDYKIKVIKCYAVAIDFFKVRPFSGKVVTVPQKW
jgi:hypothetical protein